MVVQISVGLLLVSVAAFDPNLRREEVSARQRLAELVLVLVGWRREVIDLPESDRVWVHQGAEHLLVSDLWCLGTSNVHLGAIILLDVDEVVPLPILRFHSVTLSETDAQGLRAEAFAFHILRREREHRSPVVRDRVEIDIVCFLA